MTNVVNRQRINLDLTASFIDFVQPTPFGLYDNDPQFRHDADAMVRYVYAKLGGRMLGLEITNREVYAGFEDAMLEYSAMVNSYQAKSLIVSLLGQPTGSFNPTAMPRFSLDQSTRMAQAYGTEFGVGGSRQMHSGSIPMKAGQQTYDLQALLSASGDITAGQRIRVEEVMHYEPNTNYAVFGVDPEAQFFNQEFGFNSFTTSTAYYMLPVWENVLRATEFKMSLKVRRSNYSWNIVNNVLTVFPVPEFNMPMFLKYYIEGDDPYANQPTGVTTGIQNIPFSNMSYTATNSIGQQWVRRFAYALIKETLGQVRSKVAEVPIPDGTLTLNGLELIAQSQDEMQNLREDLQTLLESLTYRQLSEQQIDQAEALQKTLNKVPMLIYIG